MTLLILLLDDCLFLLTVFPGIVLTIEEFVPFVRRMGAVYEYAIGLLLIVMADSIYLHDAEVCLAFLAALAGSFLVLAPALVKSGGWRSVKDAWKRAYRHIFFLTLFPALEEGIYRSFIYQFVYQPCSTHLLWVYFVLSFSGFLYAHFVTQKLQALRLVPLSALLVFLYAMTRNLFLVILVHVSYNVCVYSLRRLRLSGL